MKSSLTIKKASWSMFIGLLLAICLAVGSASASEAIDPQAEQVLKSMSDYLDQTKRFSVNTDISFEVVSNSGQKFQLNSVGAITMDRPSKFYITKKGMMCDAAFIFDGKTLTLHGKRLQFYMPIKVDGTIDDAIVAYERETGIPAPGADLLMSDTYNLLLSGVKSGLYVGKAFVDGHECHHLAFREAETDWQLWIRTGKTPVPMKYVITTKWHTGAPQYEIIYRDWDMAPSIDPAQFSFNPPGGTLKVDGIRITNIGEFIIVKEEK